MKWWNDLSKEDKMLVGVGAVGVVVGGIHLLKNKKSNTPVNNSYEATQVPTIATPTINPNKGSAKRKATKTATAQKPLNKNLLLKKGSKGAEVTELQKLLGAEVDGDFGQKTQAALFEAKGVYQIRLIDFEKTKKAAVAPKVVKPTVMLPKVGQNLMSIKNLNLFNALKRVDGQYYNSGEKPENSFIPYGKHVGTFVSRNTANKYLIKRDGAYYFVDATSVKTYR